MKELQEQLRDLEKEYLESTLTGKRFITFEKRILLKMREILARIKEMPDPGNPSQPNPNTTEFNKVNNNE